MKIVWISYDKELPIEDLRALNRFGNHTIEVLQIVPTGGEIHSCLECQDYTLTHTAYDGKEVSHIESSLRIGKNIFEIIEELVLPGGYNRIGMKVLSPLDEEMYTLLNRFDLSRMGSSLTSTGTRECTGWAKI